MASSVYEYVTNRIIEQLEKGVIPWQKPWVGGRPVNYVTRKPYRGINLFLLDKGGEYITFKQLTELRKKNPDIKLKKGCKKYMVTFFKRYNKKVVNDDVVDDDVVDIEDTEDNEETTQEEKTKIKTVFVLRYYYVYHIDDVEGIESKIPKFEHSPIKEAEKIVENFINKPQIMYFDNGGAYYAPLLDYINIPPIDRFIKAEHYYSTLFHELVHSTGHKKRLNRFAEEKTQLAAFGSADYSKEELVAEMGAAMLCGNCGIENATIDNSVAYVQSWLNVLKNDKTFVIRAAALAQKACDFILNKNEDIGV